MPLLGRLARGFAIPLGASAAVTTGSRLVTMRFTHGDPPDMLRAWPPRPR